MNFALDRKHRDFYRKERWIELEGLLSEAQAHTLLNDIHIATSERTKTGKPSSATWRAEMQFLNGHDLWRAMPSLKKVVLSKSLAEAASSLIEQKPLRIGYDQVYPIPADGQLGIGAYSALVTTTPTLQELSSIQGVLCGLFLCVEAPVEVQEVSPPSTLFSLKAGNGVIFAPDLPINFQEITHRQGYTYLLIVYTSSKSVYIRQESDPHLIEFRKQGYAFGDRLSDTLNPIVFQ
jgi:hypothetical protein